nr:MAG TPA: hypothetical protein [Caudoviricetes sp.]
MRYPCFFISSEPVSRCSTGVPPAPRAPAEAACTAGTLARRSSSSEPFCCMPLF